MGKKIGIGFLGFILLLGVVYMCGPTPDFPMYDLKPKTLTVPLEQLDEYVAAQEAKVKNIRPDNEARIEWYGDSIHKTSYALVYLHGFSSSQMEGDPVHRSFAQRYGMNLYLPRLYGHGIDKDAFENMTPKDLIKSAKEAIAIGGLIGEKVIVMSCSTGGTYSVLLADDDPRVEGLIMYSPNFRVKDPAAVLVTMPWGKQIMDKVVGSQYFRPKKYSQEQNRYWYQDYHTDGIIAMQALVNDVSQDEVLEEFDKPVFVMSYYKNKAHQDQVVSVDAMKSFMKKISTPDNEKVYFEYDNGIGHVFVSRVLRDDFDEVLSQTYKFGDRVLGLEPLFEK